MLEATDGLLPVRHQRVEGIHRLAQFVAAGATGANGQVVVALGRIQRIAQPADRLQDGTAHQDAEEQQEHGTGQRPADRQPAGDLVARRRGFVLPAALIDLQRDQGGHGFPQFTPRCLDVAGDDRPRSGHAPLPELLGGRFQAVVDQAPEPGQRSLLQLYFLLRGADREVGGQRLFGL